MYRVGQKRALRARYRGGQKTHHKRTYPKPRIHQKLSDDESEVRTAYELSVSKIVAEEHSLKDSAAVGQDARAEEVSAAEDTGVDKAL